MQLDHQATATIIKPYLAAGHHDHILDMGASRGFVHATSMRKGYARRDNVIAEPWNDAVTL